MGAKTQHAVDAAQGALDGTLAAAGSKATYAGAGAFSVGWFLSSEFGILVGICMGTCGFLMNWYYSRKRDRREQAEHERRMRELQ